MFQSEKIFWLGGKDWNLPSRVRYWLSEAKHDCFFVVGPEDGPIERIGAHKILLMGDSEVFRAMLQDSALAEEGDIRVKDVEPETFRNFLKCVYDASGVVMATLTFKESVELLYVLEKYLVNSVKTELMKHMEHKFSLTDMYVALSHQIFLRSSLKGKVINFIKYNFDTITMNDKFLDLDSTAIHFIVDVIILVEEVKVWNAVLKWAKHKTGSTDGKVLRSYIFDLLKSIRFLTLDYNDFNEYVVSSGILLEDEVSTICKAFVLGKSCNIAHLCENRINRCNVNPVSELISCKSVSNPKYAIIQLTVSSVISLQCDCLRSSNSYYWCGYHFYIEAKKRMGVRNPQLDVFLGCEGKNSNWSCIVDFEASLINQMGKPDVSKVISTQTFSESIGKVWGWKSFYSWND